MIARVLNVQVPQDRCAERLEFYTGLMKQANEQDGCEQALLLGDEDTGEVVLMTIWSDEKKMEASGDAFKELSSQCDFTRAAVPHRRQLEVRYQA